MVDGFILTQRFIDLMHRLYRPVCLSLLLLLAINSCKDRTQDLLDTVNALIGKQLVIPQDLIVFNDSGHRGNRIRQEEGYKILFYLNPYSCSACKVKEMRHWEAPCLEFMDRGIPTVVLVDTEDITEHKREVDLQQVKPLFAYDVEGRFKSLNKLPDNPELQSFL